MCLILSVILGLLTLVSCGESISNSASHMTRYSTETEASLFDYPDSSSLLAGLYQGAPQDALILLPQDLETLAILWWSFGQLSDSELINIRSRAESIRKETNAYYLQSFAQISSELLPKDRESISHSPEEIAHIIRHYVQVLQNEPDFYVYVAELINKLTYTLSQDQINQAYFAFYPVLESMAVACSRFDLETSLKIYTDIRNTQNTLEARFFELQEEIKTLAVEEWLFKTEVLARSGVTPNKQTVEQAVIELMLEAQTLLENPFVDSGDVKEINALVVELQATLTKYHDHQLKKELAQINQEAIETIHKALSNNSDHKKAAALLASVDTSRLFQEVENYYWAVFGDIAKGLKLPEYKEFVDLIISARYGGGGS